MRISDIKFSRQKQKHSGKSENLKGTAILDDLKCTQERFLFGRGPNRVMETACFDANVQSNVNKASKQAKRGECLRCDCLVQGKRHVGKKALLAHGT